jgi:predicted extracellular nuclease
MGDINAYEQETPITTLTDARFKDASADYSYLFDGQFGSLDYVLVRNVRVEGAATWHVNADEPDLLDYNLDFGRDATIFDGSVPFRYSDHDPVVVVLDLEPGRGKGIGFAKSDGAGRP